MGITKYDSPLYIIGMDEVFLHYAHTFEKFDLNVHFVNSVLLEQNGRYGQYTRVPKM